MSDAERLQALRLADSMNGRTARVSVKYEKDRDELEAENAMLRELVRDMWREGAFEPGACYEKAAERLAERTRELGVEP